MKILNLFGEYNGYDKLIESILDKNNVCPFNVVQFYIRMIGNIFNYFTR